MWQFIQIHILKCPKLNENEVMDNTHPTYNDLFGVDISKQLNLSRILETNFRRRKKMFRESSQQDEKPSEPIGVLQFSN